jgi:hypothetical protein
MNAWTKAGKPKLQISDWYKKSIDWLIGLVHPYSEGRNLKERRVSPVPLVGATASCIFVCNHGLGRPIRAVLTSNRSDVWRPAQLLNCRRLRDDMSRDSKLLSSLLTLFETKNSCEGTRESHIDLNNVTTRVLSEVQSKAFPGMIKNELHSSSALQSNEDDLRPRRWLSRHPCFNQKPSLSAFQVPIMHR